MTNHEQIEELLAGYALRSLEGDDAVEAERLLVEHVPTCIPCRRMLADFDAITGDLALAADPVNPPDLLWPMIERSMGEKTVGMGRRWAAGLVAASMVALFALAGWNLVLSDRMSNIEGDKSRLAAMVKELSGDDGRRMVSLRNDERTPTMFASYLPGQPFGRLGGVYVPPPADGFVYRVWLVSSTATVPVADFVPDEDGYIMLDMSVDLTDYEQISITEEPEGQSAASLSPQGPVRWSALIFPT